MHSKEDTSINIFSTELFEFYIKVLEYKDRDVIPSSKDHDFSSMAVNLFWTYYRPYLTI